ncbi:SUMF1/EgtB/PvdO family nonheme iron enzyme [Actinoplanes sp. DH11]|uniref:formylglycine-generating enzyme family protein n=1 Tax=Actinoplanes sp. DH11 TaxID=2857011 RepID=UPI001E4889F1|nr:SUMF1/EgtB/PvdO family nonheme iron enzyme [Actinoplanes sp. DH11]
MEPSLDLITVPAGSVTLTDRRTSRTWQVPVAPFELAATPVTVALFTTVAPASGPPAGFSSPQPGPSGPQPGLSGPPAGSSASPRDGSLPVVGVSWWDAVRFCNALSKSAGLRPAYHLTQVPSAPLPPGTGPVVRNTPLPAAPAATPPATSSPAAPAPTRGDLSPAMAPGGFGVTWDRAADGYRLPTEAEWEHACRAGTTGPRYGPLDEIAWYRENSGGRLHAPGGLTPNAWGLHDMLGNAWDWCWDLYDAEVYGTYRVLRGGGWFDEHWSCRASVRRRSHPDLSIDDVSFRLARTLPSP